LTAAKLLGNSAVATDALGRLLDVESARVREAALRAVGATERTELRTRVERMLGAREPAVAAMAAWVLGEFEQRASVPALRRALGHQQPQVRLTAAWALGSIEDGSAVADLEGLVVRDSDRRVRLAAIEALGELQQNRSRDVLLGVLNGRDLEASVAAVEAIGELDDLDAAPPAIVRALESAHIPLRHAALYVLVEIEDDRLVPVLLPHVNDSDPDVRVHVIEALGELKARNAVPALTRALNDPNADVRRAAVEALAEIGERDG
jgi:HEAT repeat protein